MAKIALIVGHGVQTDGTPDCGCTNGNYTEANLMLAIGKKAAALLRNNGVSVVTDADNNNNINMVRSVELANASGVDIYVSLHCDYIEAPVGTLPIVYPGSTNGIKLAQVLDSEYRKVTGIASRGILQRDDYEVSYTNMPACIFETGSINGDLPKLIKSDLCAQGIANGILAYFGKKTVIAKPSSSTTKPAATSYSWDTKNVQYYLNICNYGAPDIDGIWGPETERCLKVAQKTNGLTADGLWGPKTESKASAQIKGYQKMLNAKGYKCDIDGIAGPETYSAVKKFQKAKGLVVDGIIGMKTLNALKK